MSKCISDLASTLGVPPEIYLDREFQRAAKGYSTTDCFHQREFYLDYLRRWLDEEAQEPRQFGYPVGKLYSMSAYNK